MSSYSLANIADATGLKIGFIKKCLQKKPHLFKLLCHQDAGESIRLNAEGLVLFQKIARRIGSTKQLFTAPAKTAASTDGVEKSTSGPSDSLSSKADCYQRFMAKHQELFKRLEQALRQVENEKSKRIQAENNLRNFFTEIKPLTDNHSIEQAIILRQNRRLRRAEIIGRLENHRFFNSGKRKKLFEELKALDTAYSCKLSEHNSLADEPAKRSQPDD